MESVHLSNEDQAVNDTHVHGLLQGNDETFHEQSYSLGD